MTAKKGKGNKFLLGAVLGGIAGGIAGILTAPKSGKTTRADMEREGKRMLRAAGTTTKKATNSAKHTAAKTKRAATSAVSAAKKELKKK